MSQCATSGGWLRRRQAVEPAIGHLKSDHRLDRCWLQGAMGDALHAISCAAGYNLRWLLRAVARLGIGPAFCVCCKRCCQQRKSCGVCKTHGATLRPLLDVDAGMTSLGSDAAARSRLCRRIAEFEIWVLPDYLWAV